MFPYVHIQELTVNPQNLKLAGVLLNTFGAVVLAYRVTGILQALSIVVTCHEANIQQVMEGRTKVFNFTNSLEHMKRAKGVCLLVSGFVLTIVGLLCQLLAFWVSAA
jgi:hypothetical protein